MNGREWRPGDVAKLTMPSGTEHIALRVGWPAPDWISATEGGLYGATEIRPLVVIDPEDDAQVTQLGPILAKWGYSFMGTPLRFTAERDGSCLASALREFANPTPPKPAEPTGLGAVVEDADGERWVRGADVELGGGVWLRELFIGGGSPLSKQYAAVNAVRVLSEGVTQ